MAEMEASYCQTLTSSSSSSPDDYNNDLVDWLFEAHGEDHHLRCQIVDIDAADVDDELAAVEYVKDMYSFYDFTEDNGRVLHYMNRQTEIDYESRAFQVGLLIQAHDELGLLPEVLFLAVNVFDRFLSVQFVPSRGVLGLVAIASLLIASKYEQDQWTPSVSHLIAKSGKRYAAEEVVRMEKAILGRLEWCLSVPTPYVYLVRFIKASIPDNKEMENMAFFYAELGITDYWTVISKRPSMLAASAVYAARCTLKRRPLWTETLKHYTGYYEDELVGCARFLMGCHSSIGAGRRDLQQIEAVARKYSKPERGCVALFPPSRNLLSSWKFC